MCALTSLAVLCSAASGFAWTNGGKVRNLETKARDFSGLKSAP